MIPLESIVTKDEIASTKKSIVYIAHVPFDDQFVQCAIKRIDWRDNLGTALSHSLFRDFERELSILSQIDHENIVNYYGFSIDKSKKFGYIIMELCDENILKHVQTNRCDWVQKISFLKQICEGLDHLHKQNIVHRDVKPHNCLVLKDLCTKQVSVKLTDFGSSSTLKGDYGSLTLVGTPGYIAPELILGKKILNPKMLDMYSFGITMWSIFKEEDAFLDEVEELGGVWGLLLQVLSNDLRPNLDGINCPDQLKELMIRCWCSDPLKRPKSFSYVINVLNKSEREFDKCHEMSTKLNLRINPPKCDFIINNHQNYSPKRSPINRDGGGGMKKSKSFLRKLLDTLKRLSPKRKKNKVLGL